MSLILYLILRCHVLVGGSRLSCCYTAGLASVMNIPSALLSELRKSPVQQWGEEPENIN